MQRIYKGFIFFMLCFLPFAGFSQDSAPKENQQPKSSHAQKRQARRNWKEQRRIKHDEKKKIKDHHKRLQTKKTLRRMKKDKKKAARINGNKREFFLKRWFSK